MSHLKIRRAQSARPITPELFDEVQLLINRIYNKFPAKLKTSIINSKFLQFLKRGILSFHFSTPLGEIF